MEKENVRITGIEETNRNILKQNKIIAEHIRKPVLNYSKEIVKRYREKTPIGKTRNLYKSIAQKMVTRTKGGFFLSGTARSIIARKGKKGFHRHLVAYGTSVRTTKTGENRGKMPANREFADVSNNVEKLPFDIDVMKLLEEDRYL